MSVSGQTRKSATTILMSVKPPKADLGRRRHFRFVPIADIAGSSNRRVEGHCYSIHGVDSGRYLCDKVAIIGIVDQRRPVCQ